MKQVIDSFTDFKNHNYKPPSICKGCVEFLKKYNWCPFLKYSWTNEQNAYFCTKEIIKGE